MSHWDRIALLNLSDAIKSYLKDPDATEARKLLLEPVLKLCDHGSKSVNTSTRVLQQAQQQLVDICTHSGMGACPCRAGAHSGHCRLFQPVTGGAE